MNMNRKESATESKLQAKKESPIKNDEETKFKSSIKLEYALIINNGENNQGHRIIISEPLDILPKSMQINEEPVKTGAPISFLALERLMGYSMGVEKLGK